MVCRLRTVRQQLNKIPSSRGKAGAREEEEEEQHPPCDGGDRTGRGLKKLEIPPRATPKGKLKGLCFNPKLPTRGAARSWVSSGQRAGRGHGYVHVKAVARIRSRQLSLCKAVSSLAAEEPTRNMELAEALRHDGGGEFAEEGV